MRVGIQYTGGVLLGGGVDGDASIRGIAVNIAARMNRRRRPAAAHQRRHLRAGAGGFDVERDPIAGQGVDASVVTYLSAARGRAFRALGGALEGLTTAHDRPRRAELAILEARVCARCRGPASDRVTVVAEAGVARAELVAEFEQRLRAASWTTCASCAAGAPQTSGQPYWPAARLRWRAARHRRRRQHGRLRGASRGRHCAVVRGRGRPRARAGPGPPLLGHLIGLTSVRARTWPASATTRARSANPAPSTSWPRCCAAVPAARRWCCCWKTCTGPTTPRLTCPSALTPPCDMPP